MDEDRPMLDGRDLLEFELQDLIRKVWNEACKYGDALYYAGVDKEVFLRGYDCDIHELLISYLDGPTSDAGAQDEASEEGETGDTVRSEGNIDKFIEGFVEGIQDKSAELEAKGTVKKVVGQLDQARWYEGEIPEGWKKSPNAIASDFFRQYSRQYRCLQNPR